MCAALGQLCREESGAAAIEYAMIASLIALVVFSVTQQIGSSVSGFFATISTSF
jgi:Flp pilus assembly pilin Flp